MNPINWTRINIPSNDINPKTDNKIGQKNNNTNSVYQKNININTSSVTNKLDNQSKLANQASSHSQKKSGVTADHIKNSTSTIKPERKISASLETLKSAVYRYNSKFSTTQINSLKFEILARNILNKSTAPQSKATLENFKSDLKKIKDYLDPKIYSQIKNPLDNQLKNALEHKNRLWN